MNETKLDILKDALEQVHARTSILIYQNTGRWDMNVEHDRRTMKVLECNMRLLTEALEAVREPDTIESASAACMAADLPWLTPSALEVFKGEPDTMQLAERAVERMANAPPQSTEEWATKIATDLAAFPPDDVVHNPPPTVMVPSKEETTALINRLWAYGTDDSLAAILAIRSRDLEIRKLQKEHAELAAGQCLYGQVGDEYGHFECTEVTRLRHNVRIVELDRDRQMERAELLAKERT